MIAGHVFGGDAAGRCSCGRTWAEIAGCTEADIGRSGIAHVGHLSADEWLEIIAERERVWAAVAEVAG